MMHQLQSRFVFYIETGKIDRVHKYFDMATVKRIKGIHCERGWCWVNALTRYWAQQ